jgi:hypothetical protein
METELQAFFDRYRRQHDAHVTAFYRACEADAHVVRFISILVFGEAAAID